MRRPLCILLVLGLGGCGVATGESATVPAAGCHARGTAPLTLPDPRCTPGAIDPRVTHEYDHLIPLELGGAPNDTRNLWPEPGGSPNPKDRLEDRLRREVCARRVSLAAARREIARDWVTAYRRTFG